MKSQCFCEIFDFSMNLTSEKQNSFKGDVDLSWQFEIWLCDKI